MSNFHARQIHRQNSMNPKILWIRTRRKKIWMCDCKLWTGGSHLAINFQKTYAHKHPRVHKETAKTCRFCLASVEKWPIQEWPLQKMQSLIKYIWSSMGIPIHIGIKISCGCHTCKITRNYSAKKHFDLFRPVFDPFAQICAKLCICRCIGIILRSNQKKIHEKIHVGSKVMSQKLKIGHFYVVKLTICELILLPNPQFPAENDYAT